MESIKLNVKKDYLPVDLISEESGEVIDTLRFYYDDNTIQNFEKDAEKVRNRIEKLDKTKKAPTVKEDEILQEWFDYVLGDGAYEKIKVASKSIINRKELLIDLSVALSKALFTMKEKQDEKQANFYAID